MNERFDSSYDFIARLQLRKMQESAKEVEIQHTTPSDISGEGTTQKVDLKRVKKRVDKAQLAKSKDDKAPDIEHTVPKSISGEGKAKAKSEELMNENILMLSALEKIMNPNSTGKEGALGVAEYLKSAMGGQMDPQLQQYIDNIMGIITRKSTADKVDKNVQSGGNPSIKPSV